MGIQNPDVDLLDLAEVSQDLAAVRNDLEQLVSQTPELTALQGVGNNLTDRCLLQSGKAIHLTVERDGLQPLILTIMRDATVKELKTKVKEAAEERIKDTGTNKQINWKSVWKRYYLISNRDKLLEDCRRLSEYALVDGSELRFGKRLKQK